MWRDNKQGGRLTKLRFVCSLCGVNCIDEHGFAQHLASEKHQANESQKRAMPAGPTRYFYDQFSNDFEAAFLECLAASYLDRTALAHDIYHETFEDDRPMKMLQRTCWDSLGSFIGSLRNRGRLDVATRTAKGWEIALHAASLGPDSSLPGEPLPRRVGAAPKRWNEAAHKSAASSSGSSTARARLASETDWALLAAERLASTGTAGEADAAQPTDRTDFETKVSFGVAKRARQAPHPVGQWEQLEREPADDAIPIVSALASSGRATGRTSLASAPDDVDASSSWARPGLIVKVLRGPGSWRKRKGAVMSVRCRAEGAESEVEVEALDEPGTALWTKLSDLETVIPQLGRPVQLLAGAHRGTIATLRRINEAEFCVEAELPGGGGKVVLPYEDVCKITASRC